MKYTAPKAEVVELEISSDILLFSELLCIIDDPENSGCEDKLPDFYSA